MIEIPVARRGETRSALVAIEKSLYTAPFGDYYEFGVYRGQTLRHAAKTDQVGRIFWGFDSFQGLPKPEGIDAGGEFHEGQFTCSFESVWRTLIPFHLRVRLVPGWFADSLRQFDEHRGSPVAVAFIDCDLYASAVEVLRFLGPRLQHGSILLFDDWCCFGNDHNRGEQRAFNEWLASSPEWRAVPYIRFDAEGYGVRMERV
jgi:hypothetical protein